MKKNKFWTVFFSFLPGAGHLYLGLTKKGILFMTAFWLTICIATILYFTQILFILPIIWFYSFFDAVNSMNYTVEELKEINSKYEYPTFIKENTWFKQFFGKRHVMFGAALIVLGGYLVLNSIASQFYYNYYLARLVRIIPSIIIPLIIICIGVKLIVGNKPKGDE